MGTDNYIRVYPFEEQISRYTFQPSRLTRFKPLHSLLLHDLVVDLTPPKGNEERTASKLPGVMCSRGNRCITLLDSYYIVGPERVALFIIII